MADLDKRIRDTVFFVVNMLKEENKRLAVAESVTGGLVSSSIVSVDGASNVFTGGIVSYTPRAKNKWLGVRKKTMERYGLISRETAAEMVLGIIRKSGADYGLSFTGLAGSSDEGKPSGTVFIALAVKSERRIYIKERHFTGNRNEIRQKAAYCGLRMLRDSLFN